MSNDALLEIAHRAIVSGAKNLTLLLGVGVEFGPPSTVAAELGIDPTVGKLIPVKVSFTEGIDGDTTLAFTSDGAAQLVELMIAGTEHEETEIFGELGLSTLVEAMSQFFAGIGEALEDHTGCAVKASTPEVSIVDSLAPNLSGEAPDLILEWGGTIGPTPARLFWTMTPEVMAALTSPSTGVGAPAPAFVDGPATPTRTGRPDPRDQGLTDLGRLADVKLDVSVELGRSRIPIQELLALDEGGVIRLGRRVGEPVDLMVNGLATARGEIVVVDGRLGLRVTELIA